MTLTTLATSATQSLNSYCAAKTRRTWTLPSKQAEKPLALLPLLTRLLDRERSVKRSTTRLRKKLERDVRKVAPAGTKIVSFSCRKRTYSHIGTCQRKWSAANMQVYLAGKLDALARSSSVSHHSTAGERPPRERRRRTYEYTDSVDEYVWQFLCSHTTAVATCCTKLKLTLQQAVLALQSMVGLGKRHGA